MTGAGRRLRPGSGRPMRPRRLGAALAALAATCLLAACGGDDADAEEQRLRADVTRALTSKDPETCTDYATQRFVEQLAGVRGKAALRQCRDEAKDTDLESIVFDRVRISGARASVRVRPKGGDDGGLEALEFKLRKVGDRWKLDRLSGGTVDRAVFLRDMRKELTSPPDALSKATADCVARDLRRADDDAFVRAMIGGNPSLLVLPLATCAILNDISRKAEDQGLVRCVERRIHRALSTGPIARRLARSGGVDVLESKAFDRATDRIIAGCAREHGYSIET